MTAGKAWEALRARHGVAHWVRALDSTWSAQGGWNLHLHAAFTFVKTPGDDELDSFRVDLADRWVAALRRHGRDADADRQDAQLVREPAAVARYLSHATPTRTSDTEDASWTPGDLLATAAATGDVDALRRWVEWEGALRRQQAVTASRGALPPRTRRGPRRSSTASRD